MEQENVNLTFLVFLERINFNLNKYAALKKVFNKT